MPKFHIWLYPFKLDDQEFTKLKQDLGHLYVGKDAQKTAYLFDSTINSHPTWKQTIKENSAGIGTVVTIYVLGHSNIDYKYLLSDKNEKKNPLDISLAIYKILQNVSKACELKIKFLNCRSAFARYPRPVCEHIYRMTKRNFTGYAYAADISTLTKNGDQSGYLNYKQASIPTGGDTVAAMKAKEMRFEVWPNLATQQADGTTLEEVRAAFTPV